MLEDITLKPTQIVSLYYLRSSLTKSTSVFFISERNIETRLKSKGYTNFMHHLQGKTHADEWDQRIENKGVEDIRIESRG